MVCMALIAAFIDDCGGPTAFSFDASLMISVMLYSCLTSSILFLVYTQVYDQGLDGVVYA